MNVTVDALDADAATNADSAALLSANEELSDGEVDAFTEEVARLLPGKREREESSDTKEPEVEHERVRKKWEKIHRVRNEPNPRIKGAYLCEWEGCTEIGAPKYCAKHGLQKDLGTCSVNGCREKAYASGICRVHHHGKCKYAHCRVWLMRSKTSRICDACDTKDTELVSRIRRDHHLREKFMPRIYARQDGRCVSIEQTCEEVANGDATIVCPWGGPEGRRVPYDAMHLEHKTRLADGGPEDDPSNMQGMCACCHAMKSVWEQRNAAKQKV